MDLRRREGGSDLPVATNMKTNKSFSIESLISRDDQTEEECSGEDPEGGISENSDLCYVGNDEHLVSPFQPFVAARGLFDNFPRPSLPPEKVNEMPFPPNVGLPIRLLQKFSAAPPYFNYNWPLLYNSWLQNANLLGGLMGVPRPGGLPPNSAPESVPPGGRGPTLAGPEQDSPTSFLPLNSPTEESDTSLSPYDLSRASGK